MLPGFRRTTDLILPDDSSSYPSEREIPKITGIWDGRIHSGCCEIGSRIFVIGLVSAKRRKASLDFRQQPFRPKILLFWGGSDASQLSLNNS